MVELTKGQIFSSLKAGYVYECVNEYVSENGIGIKRYILGYNRDNQKYWIWIDYGTDVDNLIEDYEPWEITEEDVIDYLEDVLGWHLWKA